MSFDDFIATAWRDHADHAEEVASRLAGARDLLDASANMPPFASLVTHVYGEHLARWNEGIALLESLRDLPAWDGNSEISRAIVRGIATLQYAGDLAVAPAPLATEDRIAVLASASSALAGQRKFQRAITAYDEALRLAARGLPAGSPALRALAIGGNNLAASLEEKSDRDAGETRGMVAAAEGGLTYWKLAGTWLEEERAEYRLARSLLQAGDHASATEHARRCVDLCIANDAASFERFFGYAALAIAQLRGGDETGFALSRQKALDQHAMVAPDERQWCEAEVNELGR